MAEVRSNVLEMWPAAEVLDASIPSGHLAFSLPQQGLDLPGLFASMTGQEASGIEEYSVSQTTLEQVFIALARSEQHA